MGEIRAYIGHAEDAGQERGQVVHPGVISATRRGQGRVAFGQQRVVLVDHGRARRRRSDDRLISGEGVGETARYRRRLTRRPVIRTSSWLSATGQGTVPVIHWVGCVLMTVVAAPMRLRA